jgi:hypothetical protein
VFQGGGEGGWGGGENPWDPVCGGRKEKATRGLGEDHESSVIAGTFRLPSGARFRG